MCRLQFFCNKYTTLFQIYNFHQILLQRSVNKNLPQIYTIYPKYTKSTPNLHKIHFPTFSPNFHFLLFQKIYCIAFQFLLGQDRRFARMVQTCIRMEPVSAVLLGTCRPFPGLAGEISSSDLRQA